MIKIRNKENFLFIFIIVALSVITIVGFICCDHKSEKAIEKYGKTIEKTIVKEETIEEYETTIEIETDKDGDNSQAVKPDDEFIPLETDEIIEPSAIANIQVEAQRVDTQEDDKNVPLFYLNDYERNVAECIVMGESGHETYEGQILVAQCLLNACIKDGLQPSEVRIKYQYRGWMDNPTDSVKQAVSAVFDDGHKVTNEFILYFYAPKYSKGKWHETQRFVIELGGHRFFTEWDK